MPSGPMLKYGCKNIRRYLILMGPRDIVKYKYCLGTLD
jgi:hypothetical protein